MKVNIAQLVVAGVVGSVGASAHAGTLDSGGPINSPPRFDGYPYAQQIADFTKLGGNDYVFRGTVSDPDAGDVVTMIGYVAYSPFTFSYTPGNPAVFEVRAANLGPAAIGGYAVGFTANDQPGNLSIAGVGIVVIPEPGAALFVLGAVPFLVRRRRTRFAPSKGTARSASSA